MDLSNLLIQIISILKAKLWKVVMKFKNVQFFNFQTLFQKMHIFEVVTFFLPRIFQW